MDGFRVGQYVRIIDGKKKYKVVKSFCNSRNITISDGDNEFEVKNSDIQLYDTYLYNIIFENFLKLNKE